MKKIKKKTIKRLVSTSISPAEASQKIRPARAVGIKMPLGSCFPIVGIGASAGGLAAFEAFFSAMPADKEPGMAFILVQHLAPDHTSILSELIRRYTRMQVFEVTDGITVKLNCIYIIPPGYDMAFLNGKLQLLDPVAPRGQHLPIDLFFRSLAQDLHERAIGVVLSGTGSDGTLGLRAIKSEGGLAIVQKPESAEHDGMPRSAVNTGLIDYVLPVAEMPARLMAYAAHAFGKTARPEPLMPVNTENALKKIYILLRSHTGHDFSLYKQNTINRRIERRMAVHQIDQLDKYVQYLQQNTDEVKALFNDLLIGVTNFFRDPEVFKMLEEKVIPAIFAGKPEGANVRVWVAGCSTGEEAYSIAMLLQEEMEELKKSFKLQVFATDIDGTAITTARAGIYPASIAGDMAPARLKKFFNKETDSGHFRIHKSIRDILIFSEQDVIKDPPFSRLDMISCRNMLIYMNGELQKKLMPMFHYALRPEGYLLLGTSETVGDFQNLFTALDRKSKLYQRKEETRVNRFQPGLANIIPHVTNETVTPRSEIPAGKGGAGKQHLREITERVMLQHYAPVGALVKEDGEILYLRGRTGHYLEPSPGEAGMNILKMAREGLKRDLTSALYKAVKSKKPVCLKELRVKTNGDYTSVNLTVQPVTEAAAEATEPALFLVLLEEAPDQGLPTKHKDKKSTIHHTAAHRPAADSKQLESLKKELKAKDEYLQSTLEELETTNEELKSSNEEMQSVNEELQSTNEELETSKEELQSVNEELSTVNNELQTKVTDLSRSNNDMINLLAGTGVGTVFVDTQLRIQRFTPSIAKVINLILTDVGRPVGHIVSNLVGYNQLVEDVQSVLNSLIPVEIEVQSKDGKWYLQRIIPYRTLENVIDGAVITYTDITALKIAEEALAKTNSLLRLAVIVRDSNDAVIELDMDGRILAWNPKAEKMYGWSEAEALEKNIRDIVPEGLRREALETARCISEGEVLEPFRSQRIAKNGQIVEIWLTATALLDEAGKVYAIATTERETGPVKRK